jgi:hypothetical protein
MSVFRLNVYYYYKCPYSVEIVSVFRGQSTTIDLIASYDGPAQETVSVDRTLDLGMPEMIGDTREKDGGNSHDATFSSFANAGERLTDVIHLWCD